MDSKHKFLNVCAVLAFLVCGCSFVSAQAPRLSVSTNLISPLRGNYSLEGEYRFSSKAAVFLGGARTTPFEDARGFSPGQLGNQWSMYAGYRRFYALDGAGKTLLTVSGQVGYQTSHITSQSISGEYTLRFNNLSGMASVGLRRQIVGPLWIEPRVGVAYSHSFNSINPAGAGPTDVQWGLKGRVAPTLGLNLGISF